MGTIELLILAGALAGGFVSGLTGFGTGMVALPFWLLVINPVIAAPLVVICSVIAQLQTLPSIWKLIEWRRVAPFIIGGLFGVPAGTLLLALISVSLFKLGLGCFLITYSSYMLLRRSVPGFSWGGKPADGLVGMLAGILGGLAGLSGALPTVWASLRGWNKQQKRSVFQAFNLSILTLALLSQAIAGFFTAEVGRLVLIALPGTLLGAWCGQQIYRRIGERRFDQLVLILLLLSGLAIVVMSVETI